MGNPRPKNKDKVGQYKELGVDSVRAWHLLALIVLILAYSGQFHHDVMYDALPTNLFSVSDDNDSMVWADDFDDQEYSGWNVTYGGFSAADDTLRATELYIWNTALHESNLTSGTWSFDFHFAGNDGEIKIWFMAKSELWGLKGYFLRIVQSQMSLCRTAQVAQRWEEMSIGTFFSSGFHHNWWHIDIVREMDGHMRVYIDGDLKIEEQDSSLEESEHFAFKTVRRYAIDNVVVSNSTTVVTSVTGSVE